MAETDGTGIEIRNVEGQVVMPFYLICDVSGSMVNDMQSLNEAMAQVRQDVLSAPIVDDVALLSVITFDHEANTVVPLDAASRISLPALTARGGTEYGNAFREFHRAFEADRVRLKAEQKRIYRPCVFFLSDGEPNDRGSYLQAFKSLFAYDPATGQGNRRFPYVVSYGFRDAKKDVMASIAYPDFGETRGRWFLQSDGSGVGELLKSISHAIANTILNSGKSATQGTPQIVPPAPAAGMQFGEAGGGFVDD